MIGNRNTKNEIDLSNLHMRLHESRQTNRLHAKGKKWCVSRVQPRNVGASKRGSACVVGRAVTHLPHWIGPEFGGYGGWSVIGECNRGVR